jgi:O-antigen biosynthesis protein
MPSERSDITVPATRQLTAHASSLLRWAVHRLRRSLQPYPAVRRQLRRLAPGLAPTVASWLTIPTTIDYDAWIARYDTLRDSDRAAIRQHVARLSRTPLISVIMPVYNPEEAVLRQAIASVQAQLYPRWELCIADDASTAPHVARVLSAAAAKEPRIKVIRRASNGNISAASNSALSLAQGEFVALMDHDDLLPEHALYEVAVELDAHGDADLIFSDEDKVDRRGHRFDPHFKTDWSAELMLGQNMVSHLGVYRRSLLERLGGFRIGFEGSQDYDLALRVSEQTTPERIRHIPAILYHWRHGLAVDTFSQTRLAQCTAAARRAIAEHLDRVGERGAEVVPHPAMPAFTRVIRPLPDPAPLVSLIVPTRDRAELLARCVDGLLRRTDYRPIELLIVDNDSTEPETHALFAHLAADPRVRVIASPGPFNYSALNNRAVNVARGDILVLVNNDVDVIERHWLTEMIALVMQPDVGAVGAKLWYADDRLQHGGIVLGAGAVEGVGAHLQPNAARDDQGYFGRLGLSRDVSAVTGACLAVRRSVYLSVGGLDEANLPVAFNDVDLCLRLRERGFRVVWTPFAELYHLESATRGPDTTDEAFPRFQREVAFMRRRWSTVLDADPFYSPNFSLAQGNYALAAPRRTKPWERDES